MNHRILNPRWETVYVATAGQLSTNEVASLGTATRVCVDNAQEVILGLTAGNLPTARLLRVFPMFYDSNDVLITPKKTPAGTPFIVCFREAGEARIVTVDGYWMRVRVGVDLTDGAATCTVAIVRV